MKKMILITTIVLILGIGGTVFADPYDNYGCSMMYGAYGPGFAILGWITYILVIALIIAGIYWLIKSANSKRR